MKNSLRHFLTIFSLLFLISCSSGGGGEDDLAPTATAQSISLIKNTSKEIILSGTDPEGNALDYSIVTPPSHGTYVGTTYTPNTDYTGSDSFTFKANNGNLDSAPATISIEVTSDQVNQAPTATAQSVSLVKNTNREIVLSGTDPEGSTLNYSVVTPPSHGTYIGSTYTPNADYSGSDSFTFKANDGDLDSPAATVSIKVSTVQSNQAPTATAQSISLVKNTKREIILSGTDPEDSTLNYSVVTPPSHGTYIGSTYTPNADYSGSDSFTFKANDGDLDSLPALVSIVVLAVEINQAPTATPQEAFLIQNKSKSIVLSGTDPEENPLTFSIVGQPSNGQVSIPAALAGKDTAPAGFIYTPNHGFLGPDSFTFKASDGNSVSPPATVSLNVLSDRPLSSKRDREPEPIDGVFDVFHTYTYDESGKNQLTSDYQTTSGAHQITTSTYDDQDRLLTSAHDNDNDGQADHILTYTYDDTHGQLLTVSKDIDADGVPNYVQYRITYDANDYAQKEESDFDGDGVINQEYNYTHTNAGLRLTDQFKSTTLPNENRKIFYTYNDSGYRTKAEWDKQYNEIAFPTIDLVVTYSDFHDTGKPQKVETDTDNDGDIDRTIEWTYNSAGKKLSDRRDTDNDGDIDSASIWTYSASNQILTKTLDNENDGIIERVETRTYNKIDRLSKKSIVNDDIEISRQLYSY